MVFNPPQVCQYSQITNPCTAVTLPIPTWNPVALSFNYLQTGSSYFDIASDTVDAHTGIFGYCGARTYTLTDNSDGSTVAWASFATTTSATSPGRFTLSIDTSLYPTIPTASVAHTLKLVTKLADYPLHAGREDLFVVTILPLTCDCTYLKWTWPSPTIKVVGVDATDSAIIVNPVEDTSNRAAQMAYNVCYENSGTCAVTGSFSAMT